MNFEKYPKSKFESLASDPDATRRLTDELQDDVVQEIHEAVFTAFLKVVDGLNAKVMISGSMKKSVLETSTIVMSRLKASAT